MSRHRLKYLSRNAVGTLRESIPANLERYRSGSFDDLMAEGEWSLELDVQADLAPLSQLDPSGTPEAEISNSRLVWQALGYLSPSLACEEGIWVRLTHVECLDFSRLRWLSGVGEKAELVKRVSEHFFAGTVAGRRDDNPISRLWWNAFITNMAEPDINLAALNQFLSKADIRLNTVERSRTFYRQPLAAGIVRLMRREPWLAAREEYFRAVMRVINRLGGGMLFEAMASSEV